jgi:hypothetical protein
MSAGGPVIRWALRASAAAGAVALALTAPAALAGARTAAVPAGVHSYSTAAGHSYRHGVLPTVARHRLMHRWASQHWASHHGATAALAGLGWPAGSQPVKASVAPAGSTSR